MALMTGVNWFLAGVIGLFAGLLAERLLNRRFSIFGKLVAGLGGAVLAAIAADWLEIELTPGPLTVLALSLLGATLVLALLSPFRKPR
jgi:uncharacterized membrane protein YeaQ/YmgE (transglycosylase-associated protein family)